jgi:Sperm-tail PG-rich repeat
LKKNVPGPGNYEIPAKMTKEGPKFIFGLKISDRAKENFPGPGTYIDSYRTVKKSMPKYSFGLKSSSLLRSFAPGPGAYEPNKKSCVTNQPTMMLFLFFLNFLIHILIVNLFKSNN